jgi:GT2 family glycosyltransferase
MTLSVLTIVCNRTGHLAKLIEGLERSTLLPAELIVVDMGSTPPVAVPDTVFPIEIHRFAAERLPLAASRNLAARHAASERLLFLDVDCIPMAGLVEKMSDALAEYAALICAEVLYLGPEDARGSWTEEELKRRATPHPARPFPASGIRREDNAGLFWSLAFGIEKSRFSTLGGFDEAFTGYGAEDTDFGFRVQAAGAPLLFMGGAGAFHQHHASEDPPLCHFDDIIRNARLFHARWNFWPMEGWLTAFAERGLVEFGPNTLRVISRPS